MKYDMTMAEVNILRDLRARFGDDVRLGDLCKNYNMTDLYRSTNVLPVKKVALDLTDAQIEDVLGENIRNINFYAYYETANRYTGWHAPEYAFGALPRIEVIQACKDMKTMIELACPRIKLVLSAIKMVDRDYPGPGGLISLPRFSRSGDKSVANIVFYDTETGEFNAAPQWIGIDSYATPTNAMLLFARNASRKASAVQNALIDGINVHCK